MEVAMSIPTRLTSYLDERGTRYEICMHKHSRSSAETARAAQVPPHQLAKSVLVEDETGCVMVVLPADRNVQLGQLAHLLDRRQLRLADEARIAAIFADCDRGAVPALGMPWGVPTVIDDELESNEVVYMESGDHEQLLRLSSDQFHELMLAAQHGHFCGERTH
jgi:Ala-tRNA(Pro) deacylase